LILLDHQLPGTTGFEVCQKLLASSELRRIPVVVSSTLRKRAYVQYAELANVVDMLPKPYTEELLVTTVANALDTAALVVDSQSQGTAIPEVMQQYRDADLSGVFVHFTVREVLDFLNNGKNHGVLEVESGHNRFRLHLDAGRVQGVTATGIKPEEITNRLPDSLRELAPVLTLTGRGGFEGLVELLDTKVLDPRLLRRLLRHQAAMLMISCFTQPLQSFRFEVGHNLPPLHRRLPLDVSVLALLIEGALRVDESELTECSAETRFTRKPIRGQNLDRGGLSPEHAKIFGFLTEPIAFEALVRRTGWDSEEVRRVLYGLQLADLVEVCAHGEVRAVVVLEPDAGRAQHLREAFARSARYTGKVVRDRLALHLLIRRSLPAALVVDLDIEQMHDLVAEIRGLPAAVNTKLIGISHNHSHDGDGFVAMIQRPFTPDMLIAALDDAFEKGTRQPNECHAFQETALCHR
jgi:CheY-like chemotaxis protein